LTFKKKKFDSHWTAVAVETHYDIINV